MEYVQQRPAIPKVYIDTDVMEKTVKLTCRQSTTTADVMMMLRSNGVSSDDVLGLYRGPPTDSAHYLILASDEAIGKLRSGNLSYHNKQFVFAQLGKQVLTVRIHWLPLYFNDNLIKSVLRDYGTVLTVDRATSIQGKVNVKNGMRIVQIEVNEAGRLALPHLIKFGCGTSMLLTVPGRPPLCLRCMEVGHVRRDCIVQRSYASTVKSFSRETVEEDIQVEEPPTSDDTGVVGDQENSGVSTQDSGEIIATEAAEETTEEVMEAENQEQSMKRRIGEDDIADSFLENFPPNKVVKSAVDVHNKFDVLDLEQTALVIDEVDK